MERRLFGTDGVRGLANTYPMTAEVALALGRAAGRRFLRGDHRHRVVIGKDTRLSGYMLEPALTAGFVSAGMNVMLVGPMPTPAVAFLTRSLRADLGVMISASHNPYHDNGIKLFGPDGFKLSDEIEDEIEALMAATPTNGSAGSADLGRAQRIDDARGRYIENLKSSFPRGLTLNGLKIVVDSAHGAAYNLAGDLFFELGAEVIRLGIEPNGLNINEGCGSNEPALLREAVLREGADLGVALDGDADRLVLVDERGARHRRRPGAGPDRAAAGATTGACVARPWSRRSCPISGWRSIWPGSVLRCTAPRSATAMWSSGCAPTAAMSAASSPGTSSCPTSPPPATACWRRSRCWRCCAGATARRPRSRACSRRCRSGCATCAWATAWTLRRPWSPGCWSGSRRGSAAPGGSWCAPSGTEPVIRVMVEAEDEGLLADILETVSSGIADLARVPA